MLCISSLPDGLRGRIYWLRLYRLWKIYQMSAARGGMYIHRRVIATGVEDRLRATVSGVWTPAYLTLTSSDTPQSAHGTRPGLQQETSKVLGRGRSSSRSRSCRVLVVVMRSRTPAAINAPLLLQPHHTTHPVSDLPLAGSVCCEEDD